MDMMRSKPAIGTLSELRNASVAEDVDKLALVGSPLFLSRLVQDLTKITSVDIKENRHMVTAILMGRTQSFLGHSGFSFDAFSWG